VTPLDWLAFWLVFTDLAAIGIVTALWFVHRHHRQRAYRCGWVDGTMGHAYGHSYDYGKLAYPARHNGEPLALVEEEVWYPPTIIDELDPLPPGETTLVGTVIYPAGPPLPDHIAAMAQAVREAWEPIEREYEQRQETDTAWTKRMARQVREQLGLEPGLTAIGAGDGTGGSGET